MPKFTETQIIPYQPKQLFDLVMDIKSYPTFLPWCAAARIVEESSDFILADLVIQYKAFSEKYRSKVTYHHKNEDYFIDVNMVEGPFKHLVNKWSLYQVEQGTKVDFFIDFSFKSIVLEKLIGIVFDHAAKKMVNAFKKRAEQIYGN
jgi:coenzyme Q-binding protein COQ10